ncbi:MAG: pkn1 3 [Verrucomicrobia bacterium]|nr:pkn1 3 [Verrucomicrobiota bacterium]
MIFSAALLCAHTTSAWAQGTAPAAVADGALQIQCPVACRISIPALSVKGDVAQDRLMLEHVPVGTYTASFAGFNREISHTFSIVAGQTTRLTVNIAQGKVREGDAAAPAAATGTEKPGNPLAARSFQLPEVGITMIAVAPGTFLMGAAGTLKNEAPVTKATITRRYWLSRTEVTQAQWGTVMESNPSHAVAPDQPVERVTWDDAMLFCQRLTQHEREAGRLPEGYFYVLPLQAQWEFACRAGGDGSREDELATLGWYKANSGGKVSPAGRRTPNAWGFLDMRGNVAEWCFDWMAPYPGGTVVDYAGPGTGTQRVIRGGAYDFPALTCRAASRIGEEPLKTHPNVGFRVALMTLASGGAGK